LLCLYVATSLLSSRAHAKVPPDCEAALALVRKTFTANHVTPIEVSKYVFAMTFSDTYVMSRKAAQIHGGIARHIDAAAFMDSHFGQTYGGDAVRSRDQFRDKRILTSFRTARFLLIDSAEAFVYDPAPSGRDANLRQLHELLASRAAHHLSTLVLFEDPGNVDRYLRRLPDDAKVDSISVRK